MGSVHRLSFGALAAARTLPVFDNFTEHLGTLARDVMPHYRDLKALRKQLQRLRDHLDVFAFAWKNAHALRRSLDEGYETMGRFKDLFDSQRATLEKYEEPTYRERELKKRRRALTRWAQHFDVQRQQRWRARLAKPSQQVCDLEQHSLSRFFWGSVPFRPGDDDTGADTLVRLASALTQNARRAVKKMSARSSLTHKKNEEAFHDTRKRLRAVMNLFTNFADVLPQQPRLELVREAVSRYGAIEDGLVAWHRSKHGHRERERHLNQTWKSLRAWQTEVDLSGVLEVMATSVSASRRPRTLRR
jgi:hypothetical protein